MIMFKVLMVVTLFLHTSGMSVRSNTESLFQCSKFHFEEKVLEKLIKLEHKMDIHSDKMDQWETDIDSKMRIIEEFKGTYRNFIQSMSDNFTEEKQKLNQTYSDKFTEEKQKLDKTLSEKFTDEKLKFRKIVRDHFTEEEQELNQSYSDKFTEENLKFSRSVRDQFTEEKRKLNQTISNKFTEEKLKMSKTVRDQFTEEKRKLSQTISDKFTEDKLKLSKTVRDKFTEEKGKLETTITEIIKNKDANETVAITACAKHETIKGGKPMLFQSVVTSYGIHNTDSLTNKGYFRCERPGLYLLTLTVMVLKNGEHFRIHKNNQYLVDLYVSNGNSGHWHTSSASVIIQLDRDDQVKVEPSSDVRIYGYSSNQATCITIVKIK